jgi:hypothetical protein
MIRITAIPGSVDSIEISLTITMPFREWLQFDKQLVQSYPSGMIEQKLHEVIMKITNQISERIETT